MRFTLTIDMDNDAFGEGDYERAGELGRILARLAVRMEGEPLHGSAPVLDANGNAVGRWEITE